MYILALDQPSDAIEVLALCLEAVQVWIGHNILSPVQIQVVIFVGPFSLEDIPFFDRVVLSHGILIMSVFCCLDLYLLLINNTSVVEDDEDDSIFLEIGYSLMAE